ncbi:hypothetical protein ANO11243_034570 [Dothideomycetidae sp. 11243]|nr:hypothetical protein ANO11243_034570 [fungal sp. No.11243]
MHTAHVLSGLITSAVAATTAVSPLQVDGFACNDKLQAARVNAAWREPLLACYWWHVDPNVLTSPFSTVSPGDISTTCSKLLTPGPENFVPNSLLRGSGSYEPFAGFDNWNTPVWTAGGDLVENTGKAINLHANGVLLSALPPVVPGTNNSAWTAAHASAPMPAGKYSLTWYEAHECHPVPCHLAISFGGMTISSRTYSNDSALGYQPPLTLQKAVNFTVTEKMIKSNANLNFTILGHTASNSDVNHWTIAMPVLQHLGKE